MNPHYECMTLSYPETIFIETRLANKNNYAARISIHYNNDSIKLQGYFKNKYWYE